MVLAGGFDAPVQKDEGLVLRAQGEMDETCKGEEMSEFVILTSLVLIIGLLGFIAFMVFIIGHNLDEKK